MDCDSFVLNIRTQSFIHDSRGLSDLIDFSNLDKNPELFSIMNTKVFGELKIRTSKSIWINELNSLRSKVYFFSMWN